VRLAVLAVATGVLAGLGGAGLTLLLHVVQHAAFGYDGGGFQEGVDRAIGWRRVGPVLGAGLLAGVGWWRLMGSTGGRLPGVQAEAAGQARLPAVASTLGAALQIVTVALGASLGREGAPRELGAAAGSVLAGRAGLPLRQRRLLLAAGAGGGLAAVYDVPVSGALLAAETLLLSVGVLDLAVVALVSAVATGVALLLLPDRATYAVPPLPASASLLVGAALLGPLAGLVAVVFTRLVDAARWAAPTGWRRVPVCVLAFAALAAVGLARPEVLGNGKGPAQLALAGQVTLPVAALLLVLKPLATATCLRGGAIGGLLTPAYATGALGGLLAGAGWTHIWTGPPDMAFALVGGAAVLAGTLRAPLTAVALGVELTGARPGLLAPLVLAAAGSALVHRRLGPSLAR